MAVRGTPTSGASDPLDLHGVVPPTLTVFDDHGEVDEAGTAAHAEFVVENGVHGVFCLGTNGEFPLLGPAERELVVETVSRAVDVPVLAGVGAPGTRRTVRNAERAVDAGADGIVVVTPFYYPVDGEAMVAHYRTVVETIDVPVYGYNMPSRAGNEITLDALDEIAALDGFAGLKDSSRDVPWLGRAMDRNPDLTYLVGADSLLVPGLDLGCAGIVSSLSNVFPELVVELYQTYRAGDRDRAVTLQRTAYRARAALDNGPYLAGVKGALELRDVRFDPGHLRDPLQELDPTERGELLSRLRELGLLAGPEFDDTGEFTPTWSDEGA
jgi:dihydrodipicolinate synthase/N-acetylneuraminate lyase